MVPDIAQSEIDLTKRLHGCGKDEFARAVIVFPQKLSQLVVSVAANIGQVNGVSRHLAEV